MFSINERPFSHKSLVETAIDKAGEKQLGNKETNGCHKTVM